MLQTFDERNRNLLININGELIHRDQAGISPFDSAVQGADDQCGCIGCAEIEAPDHVDAAPLLELEIDLGPECYVRHCKRSYRLAIVEALPEPRKGVTGVAEQLVGTGFADGERRDAPAPGGAVETQGNQ